MSRRYRVRSHGHARPSSGPTTTYKSWLNMHQRCRREGVYEGVTVCARWTSFEAFLADLGERPSPKHSIDRIDNGRGYEPGNCRWATIAQQARNKTTTVMLTHPGTGETLCMADWAARLGVRKSTLHWRLKRWPIERALSSADHRRSHATEGAL